MKPPNLITMMATEDRTSNTATITPQADELLKDLLALAQRAREVYSNESSPNRCTRAEISLICIALNGLGIETFEILRTTKVD